MSMQLSITEINALMFVASRHGDDVLSVSAENTRPEGYVFVTVNASPQIRRLGTTHEYYLVSPTGRVWKSNQYHERILVIREADFEQVIKTAPIEDGHVKELIDHLAHLDDAQTERVRDQLNVWHAASQRDDRA